MVSQLVKELTISAGKYNATILKLLTVSESLRYYFIRSLGFNVSLNILCYKNTNVETQSLMLSYLTFNFIFMDPFFYSA